MMRVAPCVLIGMAAATDTPDYEAMWATWKLDFGKTYVGEEDDFRWQIFRRHVVKINEVNSQNLSYKLGLNALSDLTWEELVATRMGVQKPGQLYGSAKYMGNHTWNGEALPASVDWVQGGAVTPVKNQGQCGSCWIFSAIGSLEGAYKIATGKLLSFAEQQILDCEWDFVPPTFGCHGGMPPAVFKYAEKHSLCLENSYPYEAKSGKCRADGCTMGLPEGRVTGYKSIAPVSRLIPASMETMMSAVAQQPVSVSLQADKDVFHHYHSGIIDHDCGIKPDHAVLTVGYGTDPQLKMDYWKVKNSWDVNWGEDGYVRLKRGAGTGWYGECAILNGPSYPIVSYGEPIAVVV